MVKFIKLLTVFLIICEFKYSTCFEWVSRKSGDRAYNAVKINYSKYVGRSKYLNTLQPAEIHRNPKSYITEAVMKLYSKEIVRDQFEVLVATEHCEWVLFDKAHIPENMVRGGTAWNFEPIYVGRDQNYDLVSIFLTSNKIKSSGKLSSDEIRVEALICDNNHNWVETTVTSVPENTVSTGGNDSYVARVLGPALHIPGTVSPKLNQTYIWRNGIKLESFNIEVLVDESQKYSWETVMMGTGIPENAVVCGVSDDNELTFISKQYRYSQIEVFPISFSKSVNEDLDILVENKK